MANEEYRLPEYEKRTPEYDGPYLKGAEFDPKEKFAHAGDVKKAAEAAKKEKPAKLKTENSTEASARRAANLVKENEAAKKLATGKHGAPAKKTAKKA